MSVDASQPRDGFGPVVHRTKHETGALSTSVLMALDSLPGFDAEMNADVLFTQVDPDALDALFQSTSTGMRSSGRVSFPIDDYHVTVNGDGDIVIRERHT